MNSRRQISDATQIGVFCKFKDTADEADEMVVAAANCSDADEATSDFAE
jgi:hypothetical protein